MTAQLEGFDEQGKNYTRGIWNGPDGGERIWIEVHDDGTLTAANTTLDGCIQWGDTVTIEGETDETWGNVCLSTQ